MEWKLIVYPIAVILILGIILNITVYPFLDSGLALPNNPSFFTGTAYSIIDSGNVFNITSIEIPYLFNIAIPNIFDLFPAEVITFIKNQVSIFEVLPLTIQIIIGIILILCLALGLFSLVTEFIIPLVGAIP